MKKVKSTLRVTYNKFMRRPVLTWISGYKIVNPYGRSWHRFSPMKMQKVLDHIFHSIGAEQSFESMIEHGCGHGDHYSKMLKSYTNKLVGVDILPSDEVRNVDDYIQVSPDLLPSYFDSIDSDTVDSVVVLSSIGINVMMHPGKSHKTDWREYIADHENRQGRYFSSVNYPRIIAKGGYLVICEWEAYPERRFGKDVDVDFVKTNIDKYYPHSEIRGFEVVLKSLSCQGNGPFIVYRKMQ